MIEDAGRHVRRKRTAVPVDAAAEEPPPEEKPEDELFGGSGSEDVMVLAMEPAKPPMRSGWLTA